MTESAPAAALQAMKREGRKIVGVVAWDAPTAKVLDRAGVDIVSAGDSVGVHLWGRAREGDVTLDEMVLVCRAVSLGAERAFVSCDLPISAATVGAACRLAGAGADFVKVEGSDAVAAIAEGGVAVFAQLDGSANDQDGLVAEAKRLEQAGAALIDFRHSGPDAGAAVVAAVSVPVIGGLGGGPWLDGRMRLLPRLVDVAPLIDEAVRAYADNVRSGRPVKGD